MRLFGLFFIFLFIQIHTANAQRDSQLGGWYVLTVKKSFDDSNWDAQAQLHSWNYDVLGDVQIWIYGGIVSYAVPETPLKISAGFLHLDYNARDENRLVGSEERGLIAVSLSDKLSDRFTMQHRLMLEQRWITNQDFRTRIRVLHQVAFLLNAQSNFPAQLVLSNELFLNGQRDIGIESQVPIFDQNRTLLTVNKKVLDWLSVQGGVRHILSNSSNREVIDLGVTIRL